MADPTHSTLDPVRRLVDPAAVRRELDDAQRRIARCRRYADACRQRLRQMQAMTWTTRVTLIKRAAHYYVNTWQFWAEEGDANALAPVRIDGCSLPLQQRYPANARKQAVRHAADLARALGCAVRVQGFTLYNTEKTRLKGLIDEGTSEK